MRLLAALFLALLPTPVTAFADLVLKFSDAAKADCPGKIALGTGAPQQKEDWFRENGSLQVHNVSTATMDWLEDFRRGLGVNGMLRGSHSPKA